MIRLLLCGTLLLAFGCAIPAERVPLRPLPENGQVLPYAELLTRIRAQASAANEAFYLDHWNDLEDMAKGIEQTSRFLSKAEEVPEKNRKLLKEVTTDLGKSAHKLRDAAAAHNVKDTTDALQQINAKVRDLRLTDVTDQSSDRPKE
jgi:predicted  nucleic acid-binding Zn-ribbon protein